MPKLLNMPITPSLTSQHSRIVKDVLLLSAVQAATMLCVSPLLGSGWECWATLPSGWMTRAPSCK